MTGWIAFIHHFKGLRRVFITTVRLPIPWSFIIIIEFLLSWIFVLGLSNLRDKIPSLLAKWFDWWCLSFKTWTGTSVTYSSKEFLFLSYELLVGLFAGYFVANHRLTIWLSCCYFEHFIIFTKRKELHFFRCQMIQIQYYLSNIMLHWFVLKLCNLNENLHN